MPPRFVFRYKEQLVTNPRTGAQETYHSPLLPCVLEWRGKRSPQTEGLLDSGSDGVVLPLGVARYLDLDLRPVEAPMQVVGTAVPQYVARVDLTIGRAGRFHTFADLEVSVPREGETPIIIGRRPVFEVYRVTFVEPELKFVLDPYK